MEASWWDRLTEGKIGLVLMGGAMISKSLIQFFVDAWGCVPSLLFTWGQTMVEVIKITATSLKKSHACTATLSAPSPGAGHQWPTPPLETPRHLQASPGQSLWGHCSFLLCPGAHKVLFVPVKSPFPVLCRLRWLNGGVNGNLLQEDLMPSPGLLHPEPLWQSPADPYLHRRHSNTILSQSLWGLLNLLKSLLSCFQINPKGDFPEWLDLVKWAL